MTERLENRCPNGHAVRPDARFCPACGTEVTGTKRPPDVLAPALPDRARRRSRWVIAGAAFALVAAVTVGAAALRPGGGDDAAEPDTPAPPAPSPTLSAPETTPGPPTTAPPAPPRRRTTVPPPPPREPYVPRYLGVVDYAPASADPRAFDVAWMLDAYFSGINERDYERTRAVIDSRHPIDPHSTAGWSAFIDGVSTTYDSDIVLREVADDHLGEGSAMAWVTFQSTQDPGYGPSGSEDQTCTRWDMRYTLSEPTPGQFLLLSTGAQHTPC
jgi:hypothetical protein